MSVVWHYYGMTTPAEQLATDALKPASISNDGVSVSNRSLSELIEADKYLSGKTATQSPAAFLRKSILRIVPPGGN